MKFVVSAATLAALFSMLANANYTQNPIHAPMGGDVVPACKEYIIKWTATTPGRVDILLKKGPSDNLGSIGPITVAVPNSGVFFWQVPCDLATGNDYAIEIVAGEEINFTGLFSIENSGKTKPDATTATTSEYPTSTSAKSTTSTEKEKATSTPKSTGTATASTGRTTSVSHSNTTSTTSSATGYPTHTAKTTTSTETTTSNANSTKTGAKETSTHPIEANSAATLKGSFALVATLLGAALYIL